MSSTRPHATRPADSAPTGAIDRFFEITRRGSTIGTEVRGYTLTIHYLCPKCRAAKPADE